MLNPNIAHSDTAPGQTVRSESRAAGSPRRILCVFPRYEPSIGSLEYAYDITGTLRAFMPPQGLLVIAAALPEGWEVRFVDENVARAKRSDFRWADVVFVSGMLFKVCWKLGVLADYRRVFWDYASPRIKKGRIEDVITAGILAKHLITYARNACAGKLNASNFSARLR